MKHLKKKSHKEQMTEGSQGLKTLKEFKEMEEHGLNAKDMYKNRICYCWACKVQFEDNDLVEVRIKQTSDKDAPWPHVYCPLKRGLFGRVCGQALTFDKEFTFRKEYHVL